MALDLSLSAWTLRDTFFQGNLRNLSRVRLPSLYQKALIRVEVKADHPTLKPHYRRGGWINQVYQGLELDSRAVPLNKGKILRLPNYGAGGYSLEFRPAGLYLVSYSLNIWEYRFDDYIPPEIEDAASRQWFASIPGA